MSSALVIIDIDNPLPSESSRIMRTLVDDFRLARVRRLETESALVRGREPDGDGCVGRQRAEEQLRGDRVCEDVHVDGAVVRDAADVEEARRRRPGGIARIGRSVEEVYGGIYPAVMFF